MKGCNSSLLEIKHLKCRVGGVVVSVLSFYSNDLSLNPAEAGSIILKSENERKEASIGSFKTVIINKLTYPLGISK